LHFWPGNGILSAMRHGEDEIRLPVPWLKYVIALVLSMSVLLGAIALPWDVPKPGFLLLNLLAVMLSTYAGGFGPGLLATAIGGIGATYFLLPPVHSLHITARSDIVVLGIFASAGFLAAWLLDWANERA
jgi:K+-sensing histidine kinase KdpD